MKDSDLEQFVQMWAETCEVYGPRPSDNVVALVYRTLESFDLADIQAAIASHLGESKFSPKPADIIERIHQAQPDGHPGADEAWAIAIEMMDENRTVITTQEIMYACPNATKIYNDGDPIGARMAFRQAYEPILKKARENGMPAIWTANLGLDPGGRKVAIMSGIEQGLLAPGAAWPIKGQLTAGDEERLEVLRVEHDKKRLEISK